MAEEEEKPPLFQWGTQWRATIFGLIVILIILIGLYIEYPDRVLYGKGEFGAFKPLFKWRPWEFVDFKPLMEWGLW